LQQEFRYIIAVMLCWRRKPTDLSPMFCDFWGILHASKFCRDCRGRDHMVIEFAITRATSVYHFLNHWFRILFMTRWKSLSVTCDRSGRVLLSNISIKEFLIGTTCSGISYHLGDIYCICRCCWNVATYKPLVANTSRSFPHSWLIRGFVTRLTRRVSLVEQQLLTLPKF
jgi:hypothetical protein